MPIKLSISIMVEKTYKIYESKGQLKVTLPKVLAQNFKLKKGDSIKWEKSGDNLMIVKT